MEAPVCSRALLHYTASSPEDDNVLQLCFIGWCVILSSRSHVFDLMNLEEVFRFSAKQLKIQRWHLNPQVHNLRSRPHWRGRSSNTPLASKCWKLLHYSQCIIQLSKHYTTAEFSGMTIVKKASHLQPSHKLVANGNIQCWNCVHTNARTLFLKSE